MFNSLSGVKVYLVLEKADMRKSVDGLSIYISEHMDVDIFSGSLFVFCNKRCNILKILYWDRNGFCIWYKRLEKEKFRWPVNELEVLEISNRELSWLLDGIAINQPYAYQSEFYSKIS